MTRFSKKDNPFKRWECDACFQVYQGYAISKNGGVCPNCGNDTFTEFDKSEPIWKPEGEK